MEIENAEEFNFETETYDSSHGTEKDKASLCKYRILNTQEIVNSMEKIINEVACVICIPPTIIRIILHHFKWDTAVLMEKYYDLDPEKFFEMTHVVNPFKDLQLKHKIEHQQSNNVVCSICFSSSTDMVGLQCDHIYCSICWNQYLCTKIMEEGLGQTITCAAPHCDIFVDDETVMKLVNDPKVKEKYQYLITNSFVSFNRYTKWCPAPGCMYAIYGGESNMRVKCKCEFEFCFCCGENWHEPISCVLLKKFIKRNAEDVKTVLWIETNTKECPKCKASIEKTGGCNHMTCKHCAHEFCWLCLLPNKGGHHDCIIVTKNQSNTYKNFLKYHEQYIKHKNLLDLEKKLKAQVKEFQCNNDLYDLKFLIKAVNVLCESRQILMNATVFAYYVHTSNQSLIFEDNLCYLETATTELSAMLQKCINSDDFLQFRISILDKYKYCDEICKKLLDHIEEDHEWRFMED